MLLEVLTPQKLMYRGYVEHVRMPGIDGSFGVMKKHAPLISALEEGTVEIDQIKAENINFPGYGGTLIDKDENKNAAHIDFKVTGGVVEVYEDKIIILTE